MNDQVIDTNVLLVASAVDPYSPFGDSHLPIEEQTAVFNWLSAFRSAADCRLVLDDFFRIYDEYRHKLTDQDFGLQVVTEKLQACRIVALEWDRGLAVVPPEFDGFDPSDRKFLAAALADPVNISIVNAADSDWLEIEEELGAAGVRVIHIVETWLRASAASRK